MRPFGLLLFFTCYQTCYQIPGTKRCCKEKVIKWEREAGETEFPFVARIQRYFFKPTLQDIYKKPGWKNICAASLLSTKHVLTTYSCLKEYKGPPEPEHFRAAAGSVFAVPYVWDFQYVKTIILSEKTKFAYSGREFRYEMYEHDIAIGILQRDFEISPALIPATYIHYDIWSNSPDEWPYLDYVHDDAEPCFVPGWGNRADEEHFIKEIDEVIPKRMVVTRVKVLKMSACRTRMCGSFDCGYPMSWAKFVCAEMLNKSDLCWTDRGAPLVCKGIVVGFLSVPGRRWGCSWGKLGIFISAKSIADFRQSAFRKSEANLPNVSNIIIALITFYFY